MITITVRPLLSADNRGVDNRGLTVLHISWAYQILALKIVDNRGLTVLYFDGLIKICRDCCDMEYKYCTMYISSFRYAFLS